MRKPVAYIRKSVVQKGARLLSPEVQEAEVRKLAERYGDTDLVILSDLGKSGGTVKRPGYQQLLADIEQGRVSTVYAYSLSRLNRSVRDYSALADLCVEKRVAVRLVHEGEQDFTTPNGRFIATILAAVAQMQREIDGERQRDNIRARSANGERHGEPPYGAHEGESVEAVADAYRQTGSLHGAARLLDEWGIPTRRGNGWRRASVRKILASQSPGTIPPGQVARAKGAPPFRLARLLRCHCGRILTGVMVKGHVRYRCTDTPAGHGKSSIAEDHILGWVKEEAARFRVPVDKAITEAADAERAAMQDRLDNLSRQHEMGIITDAQLAERARAVQEAAERLEMATVALDVPQGIDWAGWTPEAVNKVLRTYWHHVELGADVVPVRADWRLPAEYVA
jgi:DNA invertase Pin-like site-specific DNA recombinase